MLRSWQYCAEERRTMPGSLRPLTEHITAVVEWLLHAQQATPDDGVSASYSALTCRWQSSYPETAGYIICSLLRAADAGFDPKGNLTDAAQRIGLWLTTTQFTNGAFPGGTIGISNPKPAVFNTGQIVKGHTDLLERGLDPSGEIARSARQAVDWMIAIQDDDGCWRQGISSLTSAAVHSYNVRAAWAMARYGYRFNDLRAVEAAIANARWVCSVQKSDGWFDHMNFDVGVPPLTHTIAYTLQGLMEVGALTHNEEFIERADCAARAMFRLQNRDTGAFPGQCAEGWRPIGQWTSNTGNAQMAIVGHRLSRLTGDTSLSNKARLATEFCKQLQEFDHRDPGRRGAVRGSYPGHLGYGRYWYMNWTQKFYLDALLAERGIQVV
jgi:hypothetical protein